MTDTLVVNEIYLSLQGESTFAGLPCVFVRLTGCNLRCSYCDTAYAFTQGERMSLDAVRAKVRRLAEPYHNTASPPASCQPASASDTTLYCNSADHSQAAKDFPATASPFNPFNAFNPFDLGSGCAALCPSPLRLPLLELTGGEPLLQPAVFPLMRLLCDDGFTVLLETSGAQDIAPVDPRVRRVMDLKCPSSGEVARNRWENLSHLKATDELKFVIGTREDYEWSKQQMAAHHLEAVCPLLFSWAHPLAPQQRDRSLKAVPPAQTPISRQELAERIVADALPVRFQIQLHKVIWPPEKRGV